MVDLKKGEENMELEDIESKIADLENAYSEIELAIQSFPTVSNGKTDVSVLEQILDGLQYFINELTWEKEQLESKMENELDWKD